MNIGWMSCSSQTRRSVSETAPARPGAHATAVVSPAQLQQGLLVALLVPVAFLVPYLLRGFDDNRLLSWRWVFADTRPGVLSAILLLAAGAAFALARRRPPRRAAPLLFIAALGLSLPFWQIPEVNVDTARYFTQAKHLASHGIWRYALDWGQTLPVWTDLPLTSLLHGLMFSLVGEERLAAQLLGAGLYAGTVVLTYRLGRELWNEPLGYVAALMLLAMPYLLTQVPLLLADVPAMFFLTLAMFSAMRALERGGAWVPLAAAAVTLALFAKYTNWLLLTAVLPLAYGSRRHGALILLRRTGAIALGAGLVLGLFLLAKQDVIAEQWRLLHEHRAAGIVRWREDFLTTFLFHIHPFVAAAAVVSLYVAARRRDGRYVAIAWMWPLLLVLDVARIRYLVPAFPMLALMAAYGLQPVTDPFIRRYIATCAVLGALGVALLGYLPFLNRMSAVNLQAAGAWLDRLGANTVELHAMSPYSAVHPAIAAPLLDLHTRARVVYRGEHPVPTEEALRAPLRFTWAYGAGHPYGAGAGAPPDIVVVVRGPGDRPLPPALARRLYGWRAVARFATTDTVFAYQTIVELYRLPASDLAQEVFNGNNQT